MGAVVQVSIGTRTYDVYTTGSDALADANDYMAGRLGTTAWDAADNNNKKKALVSAVRFNDRVVNYTGVQTDLVAPQPLQWPRDGASCDGVSVPSGTTPDDLALGEFEMALILLNDATVQNSAGTGSNIKRVKAGSAEVEFVGATIDTDRDTRLPTVVNDLIGCYVEGTVTLGTSYGTGTEDGDPGYCKDDFDKSQGFP